MRAFGLLLALCLIPSLALCQAGKPGGGTTDKPKPTPVPMPPTAPGIEMPKQPNPEVLFISGEVVQEDGTQLPSGVVIERVCTGRVFRETYADGSGHFTFQVGGGSTRKLGGVMADASDDMYSSGDLLGGRGGNAPGNMGESVMAGIIGCEIRAQLAGYRSTRVILDGRNTVGQIDAGTIVLYSGIRVQGTLVSTTELAAPKNAKKALERAQKAFHGNNVAEAEKQLQAAVNIYPQYATAWVGLGQVYQKTKRTDDAREAFLKAIESDGKYVAPYIHLAKLCAMQQKWQEVADYTDKALALDPVDFADGYFFNALAYYNLNKDDVAEARVRRAQQMDPLHSIPQAHLLLANLLERKRDVPGTIDQLQKFVQFAPPSPYVEQMRSRMQRLQSAPPQVTNQPTP